MHYTIAGSESPDNFTATGLPSGLSINAKTGKITGITTAVGDYNVTIKAGNFLGFSPQQTLKIKVQAIAPTLSSISDDLTASNVLGTSASINFKIADFGGENAAVTVYYDSSDKGTVAGNWQSTKASSSALGTGSHNISLTGLTLGATYHFRVAAQNSAGIGWTNIAGTFTTSSSAQPPVVSVFDANSTTFTSNGATLIGRLNSFDGSDAPTVTVYYGLLDRNLTDSGWDGSAVVGTVQAGADFSKAVTGLQQGKKYYYRAKAANAAGSSISATSGIFATLGAPTVETAVAADVTPTSATINAKLVEVGGVTLTYPGKIQPGIFPNNDLGIHFDASAVSGMSNNEAFSSSKTWLDQSGNGRHMNNIHNSPKWRAAEATLNNKPVVDFDTENARMWTSYNFRDGSQVTKWRNEGYTAIAVARYTGTRGGQSERLISSNGGNYIFGFYGQKTNTHHFDGWMDRGGSDPAIDGGSVEGYDTDWHLMSVVHQGKYDDLDPAAWTYDLGKLRANGVKGSSNDWFMPQRLEFGARNNNSENSMGQIAEFMMFNGKLTDQDRQKVEGHLAYKYGLTLDSNHPYYNQNGSVDGLEKTVDVGGAPATVTLYWGTADGGTGSWQNTVTVPGTHGKGIVSTALTGLANKTTYYFRAKAQNSVGTTWASQTKSFVATNTLLNKDSVPDLILWLTSDDVDGNDLPDSLSDGALVHDWKDKSKSGFNIQQVATSSARPTYKSNQIGTRGAMRFDGVNDHFFATTALRDSGVAVNVFVVSRRTEKQEGVNTARLIGSSAFDMFVGNESPYSTKIDFYGDANNTVMNFKIGREDSSQSDFFKGDILEVLVFDRFLLPTEKSKVEGYLAHKWRATESLNSAHQYKEIAPVFDNSPYLKLVPGVQGFDVPSRDGLLGEWLFEDSVNDTSGNNYHGTHVGTASYVTDTPTGAGKAINLNGNKYVKVDDGQNQTVFNGDKKFTISTWVKEQPDGGWEPWISKRGESGRGWQLRREGGGVIIFTTNGPSGGDGNIRSGMTWDNSKWYHLAAVHGAGGGTKQKVYVDGELFFEQDRAGSISWDNHMLVFGARHHNNNFDRISNVYLDDVRFYNRALSAAEVEVQAGAFLNKIIGSYGASLTYQIQANRGPDTYAITAGSLPTGLTLDGSTGIISGIPTATGDFSATIKVSNTSGDDSKALYFRINRGTQTLTFSPDFSGKKYGDANMTLSGSSDVAGRTFYFGSSDETVAQVSGNLFQVAGLTNGLVTHVRFDNTTGTSATNEVGPNGTLYNMSNADWVAGKFGNALDFDGSNDYVELPESVGSHASITISSWLKPTQLAWDVIASKVPSGNTGGKGWEFRYASDASLRFRLGGSSGSNTEVDTAVSQFTSGSWHHFVASYNQDTRIGKAYLNGNMLKAENMGTRSPLAGNVKLRIGNGINRNTTNRFKGLMDDFRIYNRALTDSEVGIVYGSGNGDFTVVRTGNQLSFKKAGQANIYSVAIGDVNVAQSSVISRPLVIDKPVITITAVDKSRLVNTANPTFTYTATGFVNGENTGVFTTTPTLTPKDGSGSTIPNNSNTAGTFSIVPSGAVAANYTFNYVNGVFIVDARTVQTISWDQNLSAVAFGNNIELNASASSSLPVTFDIVDESIAKLLVTRAINLQAWWRLDGNSSSQAAETAGHDGGPYNFQLIGPTRTTGKFGKGLSFDGTNDYASAFGYKGITGGNKRTYSFWLKTATAGRGIMYSGAASGAGSFALTLEANGKLKVNYGNGSVLGNSNLANNAWHQVVVTLPNAGKVNETKIYVDGSNVTGTITNGTNTVTTATSANVTLGKVGSSFFNGLIDDLRIYSGDLKQSGNDLEVTAIYSGGYGDFNKIRIVGTGSTDIVANQPGSTTYAPALPITKTITVSKQDQTITFNPFPPKSVGDFDFDPGAVASSTLPMSYSSSDTTIAEIVGVDGPDSDYLPDPGTQKIRVRKAGTVIITARQLGSSIYNPAPAVTQTLTINYYNLFEESISGMQWWFDGYNVNADTNPDVASDTGVSGGFQWNDLSSNNRNAVQSDNSKFFTYVANGLDGKGTVRFDGPDTLGFNAAGTTKMVFAVIKQDASQSLEALPFGGDMVTTSSAGKWALKRQGVGLIDSGISSSSFAVLTFQAEGGAYALYVNGTNMGEGTDSQTVAALDTLGGNLKGEIAETVAYNRLLPGLAREKIEGYLAHKWGLEGQLPSTHKYSVALPTFGGAQEVAFQPISDKTPASAPFTVSAESSSGLPVTFDSNDTNRATVSGNTVTIVSGASPGKVGITARQAGNSNWFPALFTQTLNVTQTPRADQHITFNPLPNKNALSADFTLSAVSKRVDNNATTGLAITYATSNAAVASISGSTVSIHGQGVVTITASQDGNQSYNPASFVQRDLTITKVPQTITFNPISGKLLSQGTFTLAASASSGLTPAYTIADTSIATVSGNIVTLKAGGSTTITASQTGNSTYASANPVTQTLTVQDDSLDPQTITWVQNLTSLGFGGSNINMTATATSGLAITYSSSDDTVVKVVNSRYLQLVGAGTAVVNASQPGNAEWQAASMDKNVTVTKGGQEIRTIQGSSTLPNFNKDSGDFVFGGHLHAVRSGSNTPSGLPISYTSSNSQVIQVVGGGTKLKVVGGGSSTITVAQSGSVGYNAASTKTFTVSVTEYSPYSDSIAGMTLWLDANDVNADGLAESASDFTTIGGQTQIGVWADRSGSNHSLSQSLTNKQPVYYQSGGKNRMLFGGTLGNSNADMTCGLPSSLVGNPAMTVIVAAKSGTTGGRILQFGSVTGLPDKVIGLGESGSFEYNNGNLSPFSNYSSSPHIGVYRREMNATKGKGEFYKDGAKLNMVATNGGGSPGLLSADSNMSLARGINGSGGSSYFTGEIYEVMVFAKKLNDFAVRRLEGYLAYKWGASAGLPATHPFKSSRPRFGGTQQINLVTSSIPIDPSDNVPAMSIYDNPFVLEGSHATSGLDLVYSTSNSSVIAVNSDGMLDPKGVGSAVITVSQPGDSHFSAASSRTFSMKIIGKWPQSITFAEIGETAINATLDLNASSSRGLAVAFSATSGASFSSISGSQVTFSAVGQVTIEARQDGNSTVAAAAPIARTFRVKRPVVLSFDPIARMGNGQSFDVTATVKDAISGNVLSGAQAPVPVYSISSGAAVVNGSTVTCGNVGSSTSNVTITAIVNSPYYMTTTKQTTFIIDGSKTGQSIFLTNEKDGKGGFRPIALSPRPIEIGRLFKSSSGLGVSLQVAGDTRNLAQIKGSGQKAVLVFGSKGGGFTGFGGANELQITLRASQAGNGSYHAAANIDRVLTIKKPGKNVFFEERRMDSRFDDKKAKFKVRFPGLSNDKADYLFDSDGYDSDGDGLSNLEERAFGGDSLGNDSRSIKPKRVSKSGDRKNYITFNRYKDEFNTGDDRIEYIVETSSDLRTWSTTAVQLDSTVDIGGGMERAIFRTSSDRPTRGQQYIRVRVTSK